MSKWQNNFDQKVMPVCDELMTPVLHSVLSNMMVKSLTLWSKGVGSQGEGAVQFLVENEEKARELQRYLETEHCMPSYTLTLKLSFHWRTSAHGSFLPLRQLRK